MNLRNWVCIILLLGAGLFIQLKFLSGGNGFLFMSDTGMTYGVYQQIIETGELDFVRPSLIKTSLMTTLFPAMIVRLGGFAPEVTFIGWCVGFVVLLPVAVYFLARHFFGYAESFAAGVLVIGQFYFENALMLARINMALLFFVLGLLVLLKVESRWKYLLLLGASAMMVISHYGTTFIAIGLLMGAWVLGLAVERRNFKQHSLLFWGVALLALAFIFYIQYDNGPLQYARMVAKSALSPAESDPTMEWITGAVYWHIHDYNPTAQTVIDFSFMVFWETIGMILLGVVLARKERGLSLYIGIGSLLVMVSCMLLPYLNIAYGIIRVQYTALMVLSLFFVRGGAWLGEKVYLPGWFLPLGVAICNYFVIICM